MKRREFITLIGGAAVVWPLPLPLRAQQPATPVIGFLRSTSFAEATPIVTAFRQGLKDNGFIEGQNVAIEFRSAEGRVERLPTLVADLIRLPVAVIVGNTPSALAAKAATTTIPIVFATGGDPVREGFVSSLSRPEGNVTGVSFLSSTLASKMLELLRELLPATTTIAVLVDRNNPDAVSGRTNVQAAAPGQQIIALNASSERELDTVFAALAQNRVGAIIALGGAFFFSRRDQIVALAARYSVPAIYAQPAFVAAGGLMSYGSNITDGYRQAGTLVGKILKGAKPADLPVQLGVKVELLINLRTAKALGLKVPTSILLRADQVIE